MAKKYKKTKINYYQIKVNLKNAPTQKIKDVKSKFKKAISFKNLKVQFIDQGDGTVSAIESREINVRYLGGALVYTQEKNIPPKWNQENKKLEAININGFNGLGYDAAFFYDSENMIIAIESKVPGPTLESFCNLLRQNFNLPSFEIIVVTSTNDYEKFLNSKGVRNLEIKMLSLDNVPEKKSRIKGVMETKDLVDTIDGSYIDVKIAAGTDRNKFLNFKAIKQLANFAISSVGFKHEVTKFKVDIVDLDSGKIEPIDLITNRISDYIQVEQVTTITKFSIKEKITQIEGFYLKRKPKLDEAYRL
ncbi:hypothetical protein JI750_16525 [Flavobacterium sp. GN10]|uniref:Uncharacterized protein n=1 Tax=Flavobacterium tagetis TaxID=2801336 RepID=A0ABS1KIL8_9FLAO|nr:DUF6731 family protein [Flavobacterium tagetis]MBL0738502.1 hypothetical protein [Flavobacterium tagetis]